MKKILIAEVAVLAILVIVAMVIGFGNINGHPPQDQMSTGLVTDAPTDAPTDPPTEPPTQPPTEPPTEAPQPTIPVGWTVAARQYFVYDCDDETYLALSCDQYQLVYPASITKLFSAYVALQYLEPDTQITAGDELDLIASDSSIAYIQKGQRLTAAMLVEGMLLPSGNDAAYILATAAAREASGNPNMTATTAIAYFVDMMNATADRVGLKASHFSNPDGYHAEDHYTSSADLIVIARLALDNQIIARYVATEKEDVRYASGQTNTWYNTNALIQKDSAYYRYDAIGLKTGYTEAAGNCLLSAFRNNGKTYIVGVFGCKEKVDRFKDTVMLYDNLVD